MPHRPVILAIAGDSASGKTTLAEGVAGILGRDQVTVICTDDYHRYSRSQRQQLGVTALHPDGNDLEVLEQDVARLAGGASILKPVYDHRSGEFEPSVEVAPRAFVILEGLLTIATPRLREHPQVKIYLDPPEELRRSWKIARDTSQRGYTLDEVLADLSARESDAAEFIRPQRRWADLIVRFYAEAPGGDGARLSARLIVHPGLPQLDLSGAIAQIPGSSAALRERVGRDDGRLTELIEVSGQIDAAQAMALADGLVRSLPERRQLVVEGAGMFFEGGERRRSWPLASVELLVAAHLLAARLHKDAASPLRSLPQAAARDE
jgi:phosphoribulokinase